MRTVIALCFAATLLGGFRSPAVPPPPTAIIIQNVSVLDVEKGTWRKGRDLLVVGETIAAEGPSLFVPAEAQRVDGTGKFLIPGLWDMHVHGTTVPGFTRLYLANGVIGIRDMFAGIPAQLKALRTNMAEGKTDRVEILMAGRIVDGSPPFWPGSIVATTPEEGKKAVATAISEGAEFIKVYDRLRPEVYRAIMEEAKKAGVPVAGHVPQLISPLEAASAGQKSIEHLTRMPILCTNDSEGLLAKARSIASLPQAEQAEASRDLSRKIAESYSESATDKVLAIMEKSGVWHCPTLTVSRNIAFLDKGEQAKDDRLKYFPQWLINSWDPKVDFRLRALTAEDYAAQQVTWKTRKKIVGRMKAMGVLLLAGTDVMNPYCMPGFSLHDELRLFVECGLSPAEALRTATLNPARYLGRQDKMGSIDKGKLANLVLLNADPLSSISNTTRIESVFSRGKLYDRKALNRILEDAEKSARSTKAQKAPPSGFAGRHDHDH